MPTVTKRDLVMRISRDTGKAQQEVFDLVQRTLDGIVDALAQGNDVEFRNFGVFQIHLSRSRIGRNPHRPEQEVTIPARAAVRFRPGKVMKQRVELQTEHLKNSEKDRALL
jgi:nucleoid DNA-binding protein